MPCLLATLPAAAQSFATLRQNTSFLKDPAPAATVLGSLAAGARFRTGPVQATWRQVTVDGWIFTSSVRPTQRDGFDVVVTAGAGENLRQVPNGTIIGRAVEGALFHQAGTREGWTRVRRDVWVAAAAFAAAPERAAPAPAGPADSAPAASGDTSASGQATIRQGAILHQAAGGAPAAVLQEQSFATVLGHQGEWARVRIEGWVRKTDLAERAPDAPRLAEIEAAPDRFVGRTVVWRLQFLSIQTADALRPEIGDGKPYLLTRGPLPDAGFVYVVFTPDQASLFEGLAPLSELVVEGVIRAGRTRYLATPVVDLVRLR